MVVALGALWLGLTAGVVAYVVIGRRLGRRVAGELAAGADAVELVGGLDLRGRHVVAPFARLRIGRDGVEVGPRRAGRFPPLVTPTAELRSGELTGTLLLVLGYLGPRGRVRFTSLSRTALCLAIDAYDLEVLGRRRRCARVLRRSARGGGDGGGAPRHQAPVVGGEGPVERGQQGVEPGPHDEGVDRGDGGQPQAELGPEREQPHRR